MKKLLLVSTAAIGIVAGCSAYAADMPMKTPLPAPVPAPVQTWTGCYLGGNVGWGWGRTTFGDAAGGDLVDDSGDGRSSSINSGGAIFGGQVGCDYQFANSFVVGISGSAAAADINSAINEAPFSDEGTISTAKTNFLGDISGRLGFTYGQALFYGKGGVAWAHNQYALGFADDGGITTASDTISGAVAGLGIEWAFAQNWSAFAEYDHYFFDSKTLNFMNFQVGVLDRTGAVNVKQDLDTVKVGVNYRTNWWYH
jgi:outer membrane immunogenic protein